MPIAEHVKTSFPRERITVAHIARHLGVSLPSVRAVLTGAGGNTRVGEELTAKVRKAAADMGYRVNAAARATVTGKFNTISLLLSTEIVRSIIPDGLLDGIHDALAKHGYHLTLSKLPDSKLLQEGFVPRILSELMCDGLLINYNAMVPPALTALVQESRLPAIWINSKLPANCVYLDDFDAGRQAARVLIEAGHKHIAFSNFCGDSHYSATDRCNGYVAEMRRSGLTPAFLTALDSPVNERVDRCRRWLSQGHRPTAIVGYTEHEIWPFCRAAESLQLKIGGDLSITAISTRPVLYFDLPIDTIVVNEWMVGSRAVEALLKNQTNNSPVPPAVIAFEHVRGMSVKNVSA